MSQTSRTNTNIQASGIYSLQCSNCQKVYVGQTGTSLEETVAQHQKAIGQHSSLYRTPHNCNPNFNIVHKRDKGLKLNLIEHLEIDRYHKKHSLLNEPIDK